MEGIEQGRGVEDVGPSLVQEDLSRSEAGVKKKRFCFHKDLGSQGALPRRFLSPPQ